MNHERGDVVVAADPFGQTPRRPYLVVSDDRHPFADRQCIALGVTTKSYEGNIPLSGAFEVGRLDRESYVSPWAVVSLTDTEIDRAVARVSQELVAEAASRLASYVST